MKKIFKYRNNDHNHGEYKKDDECEILGFTYQDFGPVVWTLHLFDGNIVGVNPSCIEFVREESDVFNAWRPEDIERGLSAIASKTRSHRWREHESNQTEEMKR